MNSRSEAWTSIYRTYHNVDARPHLMSNNDIPLGLRHAVCRLYSCARHIVGKSVHQAGGHHDPVASINTAFGNTPSADQSFAVQVLARRVSQASVWPRGFWNRVIVRHSGCHNVRLDKP
jgi:hypothetical protein